MNKIFINGRIDDYRRTKGILIMEIVVKNPIKYGAKEIIEVRTQKEYRITTRVGDNERKTIKGRFVTIIGHLEGGEEEKNLVIADNIEFTYIGEQYVSKLEREEKKWHHE